MLSQLDLEDLLGEDNASYSFEFWQAAIDGLKPMAKQERQKELQTITIDGTQYKLADLSDKAKQQLANLRATDAEIERVKVQQSIMQTARNVYAESLSGQLPKPAHPNKKKGVVMIDDSKYALDDFSEEARAKLSSLQFVTSELAKHNNTLVAMNTARTAYAQALKVELSS